MHEHFQTFIERRLLEKGRFELDNNLKGERTARIPETVEAVLISLEENPRLSIRKIGKILKKIISLSYPTGSGSRFYTTHELSAVIFF